IAHRLDVSPIDDFHYLGKVPAIRILIRTLIAQIRKPDDQTKCPKAATRHRWLDDDAQHGRTRARCALPPAPKKGPPSPILNYYRRRASGPDRPVASLLPGC